MSVSPSIGGAPLAARIMSAATNNATLVKAGTSKVVGLMLSNSTASAQYVKLFDKATAPTVGTDVPKLTIQLPANGVVHVFPPDGIAFNLGLGYGIVTGVGDTDNTATAANAVTGSILYV
jgi:hypothetical protein